MNILSIVGFLCMVVLIYAAYLIYPIWRALGVESSVMAASSRYEQHPSNPTLRILVAGDSTAFGVGALDSKNSTAGRLGTLYPTADITNISVSGLKLAGLQVLLAKESQHYDLMLIQIGANDVVGFTPLSTVKNNLDSVLALASVHADHVIVLTAGNIGLSPVFRWPLSAILTARTRAVRSIFIQETGEYKNVAYVDLFNDTVSAAFGDESGYAPDHFHPSDKGYGVWFSLIEPLAKQSLH